MHNPNDGHVQALLTYRGQVKIEVGGKLGRVGDKVSEVGDKLIQVGGNGQRVGDNHF